MRAAGGAALCLWPPRPAHPPCAARVPALPRPAGGHVVGRYQPGFRSGPYAPTNHYSRIGPTVVVLPDAAYQQRFPDNPEQVFTHHLFQPYFYLAERLP